MNHVVALRLGRALGAIELAKMTLESKGGYTFTKPELDLVTGQLQRAQDHILDVAAALDEEDGS